MRREEINKKLEEAEKKEKEELSSQRKELFTERRAKQAELRLLQRKVDMAELVMKWCTGILIKIYSGDIQEHKNLYA